jgi:hypothetical protein
MPQPMTRAVLAAALRDRPAVMPPRADWAALLAYAEEQGVLPLLAAAASAASWDSDIIAAMRPMAAAQTALSIVRERELRHVLGSLAERRVFPLLLKGSHLAFTLYPSPDRRPHVDTDLLIEEGDRDGLRRCLTATGYEPLPHVTGEIAFTQFQFWRIDESGARHTIDAHWRIANPRAFADRLSYTDLRRDAVAVPRLGPHAHAPATKHALLIACLHRTAHHGTSNRLLWLYDIHLIASTLGERDWTDVCRLAIERGLAPVLAAGLEDAAESLATILPEPILVRLREASRQTDEDVLAFLGGPLSMLQVAMSDWRRLSGWRDRTGFLREHLLPSPAYMSARYGTSARAALPFLYAHRIITGARKWVPWVQSSSGFPSAARRRRSR